MRKFSCHAKRINAWTFAAANHSAAAVQRWIDAGVEIDAVDSSGGTALLECARAGRIDVAKLLIGLGADPSRQLGADLDSAVSVSAHAGRLDLIRLMASPDSADLRDKSGYTPLILCAFQGHVDCARHLISLGADPDACDGDGRSAAAWSIAGGHILMLAALADAGASLSERPDAPRLDPLAVATRRGDDECAQFIRAWRERQTLLGASLRADGGPSNACGPRL